MQRDRALLNIHQRIPVAVATLTDAAGQSAGAIPSRDNDFRSILCKVSATVLPKSALSMVLCQPSGINHASKRTLITHVLLNRYLSFDENSMISVVRQHKDCCFFRLKSTCYLVLIQPHSKFMVKCSVPDNRHLALSDCRLISMRLIRLIYMV